MSEIIKRPEYISYKLYSRPDAEMNKIVEDIHKLEAEPALEQWQIPHAFIWRESAWKLHSKVLAIPVLFLLIMLIDGHGVSPLFFVFGTVFFCVFGALYYISRSQYYSIAYKITESGMLVDNLKRYPRFRYRDQDTTKLLAVLRVIAVILIIVALLVNPIYLAGAGGAVFLSFMKPQQDVAEKALYIPYLWHEENLKDSDIKYKIHKITVCRGRRLVELRTKSLVGGDIFCTKENFERVIAILKEKLPNAEYSEK